MLKNPPANAVDTRRRFNPGVGKIPWNRKWQPNGVFLPGKITWGGLVAYIVHGVTKSQT